MDQRIEELQRALEEAQLGREEERRQREEAQLGREEERRQREEAQLGREEERRRREEEQRRREEEQRRREEEQRRRELAEQQTQGTTLPQFLQRCHDLHTSIQVVTDKSLTTQGDVTNPDNRLYPKRILPWLDFGASQAAIWERIGLDTELSSRPWFPSQNNFEYVRERLRAISSESELRYSESLAVEDMVGDLFKRARDDTIVKRELGVDSEINFQDHTNLGDEGNTEMARRLHDLRLQQNVKRSTRQQSPYRHRGTADQFCVLQSDEDGARRPSVAIEYKAPHKLTPHTIVVGLKQEIQTYEDVINQTEEPSDVEQKQTWWCRYVMAATVTQLFSYMVTQGTRYGYICTGQAYVFLRIGDDPSDVYYSVQIPSRDFDEDDPWRLHCTAVARIFAFIIQAAGEAGPAQEWHWRRDRLSPWKVDLQRILHEMPESIRTNTSDSEYVPTAFVKYTRSPIQTRARCRPDWFHSLQPDDGSGSDGEDRDLPESPSEQRRQQQARPKGVASGRTRLASDTAGGGAGSPARDQSSPKKTGIKKRAYCTHECLRGLVGDGSLDPQCPNFRFHRSNHLRMKDFVRMVKQQLLVDVSADANCLPLNLHGARGGLLKICLVAYGYTFVAKGTEEHNFKHLRTEYKIYRRLRPLQGTHVPVCLGLVELRRVYHYSAARLSHLLLMSWGGRPLSAPVNKNFHCHFPRMAEEALKAIHQLKVRHNDAEPRNMVFDSACMKLMMVDFERSTTFLRPALSSLSTNVELDRTARIKQRRHKLAEDEIRATWNSMHRYFL